MNWCSAQYHGCHHILIRMGHSLSDMGCRNNSIRIDVPVVNPFHLYTTPVMEPIELCVGSLLIYSCHDGLCEIG